MSLIEEINLILKKDDLDSSDKLLKAKKLLEAALLDEKAKCEKAISDLDEEIKRLDPEGLLNESQDIMSQYDFLEKFFIQPVRAKVRAVADQGLKDFERMGISAEEFNVRMYKDDGSMYPQFENSEVKVMSFIPMEITIAGKIKPERVLELFHENLSFDEICLKLNRKPKWVKQKLSLFGISMHGRDTRFSPKDVPFGWEVKRSKLVASQAEQWILSKIEEDSCRGISFTEIAKNLNEVGIKPKGLKIWLPETVKKNIDKNRRLKKNIKV